MKLVLIESPFAGKSPELADRNRRYLAACLRDSLGRGEAPFASHALYTLPGVLRDEVPAERALGIRAGLAWGESAALSAIYCDLGLSPGMIQGIDSAVAHRREVDIRALPLAVLHEAIGGLAVAELVREGLIGAGAHEMGRRIAEAIRDAERKRDGLDNQKAVG